MQFQTLEKLTIAALSNLFNAAFADYLVKIELSPKALQHKIDSEDISLKHSVGVFDDDKPLGFIFHAIRKSSDGQIAYNAGTGVLPEIRGKNATVRMYDFILPELKKSGVKEVVLEVINTNTPAIKSYKKVGFETVQELDCFNGKPSVTQQNQAVDIKEFDGKFDPPEVFWDWMPTWQHANQTLANSSGYKTWGAYLENKLVAYLSVNPESCRIAQFAVAPDHRRKGVGSALFANFSAYCSIDPVVINVADQSGNTQKFLEAVGMKLFLKQYKMKLKLQ